MFPVKN